MLNESNPEGELNAVDTGPNETPGLDDLMSNIDAESANDVETNAQDEDQPLDDADGAQEESTEEGETSETDAKDAPKVFKVKTGDGEIEVDESELVRGYQRLSDYTRKTQEVAIARKEVDQLTSQVASVGHHAALQELMAVDPLLSLEGSQELFDLRRVNPAEWSATVQEIEAQKKFYAGISEQAQHAMQEVKAVIIARESEALAAAIPELNNPELREGVIKDILETGARFGLSAQEMDGITDHRVARMARENAELRRQIEKTGAITKAVQQKRVVAQAPALKAGTGGQRGDARAIRGVLQTASRSHSESDLRRALSQAFD